MGGGARGGGAAGEGEEEAGREAAAGPCYGARAPWRDAGKAAAFSAAAFPDANGRPRDRGRRGRRWRGARGRWGAAGPVASEGAGGRSQRVVPQGSSSWEAADLGNEERKQKFLRLMGAGKVRLPRSPPAGTRGPQREDPLLPPAPSPANCGGYAGFSICDARNLPRRGLAAGRRALWARRQRSKGISLQDPP